MKIYHLSQSFNRGYDTYSDMVVVAPDAETARNMNPYGHDYRNMPANDPDWSCYGSWAKKPEQVTVTLVGIAHESYVNPEVICTSFHAG